jgi:hypothetical protein
MQVNVRLETYEQTFKNSFHENAGHMYLVGIKLANRNDLFHLGYRYFCGSAHWRVEISGRFVEN